MSEASVLRGQLVKATRQAAGWTQTDLAIKAGVSLATVVNVERGEDHITPRILAKIGKALEIKLS